MVAHRTEKSMVMCLFGCLRLLLKHKLCALFRRKPGRNMRETKRNSYMKPFGSIEKRKRVNFYFWAKTVATGISLQWSEKISNSLNPAANNVSPLKMGMEFCISALCRSMHCIRPLRWLDGIVNNFDCFNSTNPIFSLFRIVCTRGNCHRVRVCLHKFHGAYRRWPDVLLYIALSRHCHAIRCETSENAAQHSRFVWRCSLAISRFSSSPCFLCWNRIISSHGRSISHINTWLALVKCKTWIPSDFFGFGFSFAAVLDLFFSFSLFVIEAKRETTRNTLGRLVDDTQQRFFLSSRYFRK